MDIDFGMTLCGVSIHSSFTLHFITVSTFIYTVPCFSLKKTIYSRITYLMFSRNMLIMRHLALQGIYSLVPFTGDMGQCTL